MAEDGRGTALTHESFERAKSRVVQLSKDAEFPTQDIRAIVSIPCIEYWFLLHCRYARAPFSKTGLKTEAAKVLEELKLNGAFSKYQKTIDAAQLKFLLDNRAAAVINSKRALADAEVTGEFNPSTQVHIVLEELEYSQVRRQKLLAEE